MSTKQASSFDQSIAKSVRSSRMRLGLSQTEVAARLGVSFQQVQKYENGTNRIGAGRLLEMARIFKVPIEEFFPPVDDVPQCREVPTQAPNDVADLLLSGDGWRLSRAFLKIEDPRLRKTLIALIELLSSQ